MRVIEAGLLLVLPLVFYRGFAEQFSYVKIFLTKALIILGLGIWALDLVWGRVTWPQRFRLGPPLALLTFAVLISCKNSPVPMFSLREAEYFLCGPVWVFLLVSWAASESAVWRCSAVAAVAGTVVAAVALMQWSGHDPLLFGGYQIEWGKMVARMRLYSTFGNPNFVAGYLIGAVFPALALAVAALSRWAKAGLWAAAAVMLVAVVGAGSRGAWASLVAGLLVAGFVWRRGRIPSAADSALGGGRDGFVKARSLVAPAVIWIVAEAFDKMAVAGLTHLEGRLYLWRVSWPMFAEHPLLGGGWGTFQLRFLDLQARCVAEHPALILHWSNIRQLHNDYLQLLLEAGLLGLGALLWLLLTYGREARQALVGAATRTTRLWLAASAGGVTAILVDSFFNFQLSIPPTFLLLFTLLAFPALLMAGRAPSSDEVGKPSLTGLAQGQDRFRVLRALASVGVLLCAGALLVEVTRRAQAERDYALALRFESRGEMAHAEETYRHGLALNPLNGRLHYGLSRVLYLQDRLPQALAETLLAERTYRDSHLEVLKARVEDRMGQAGAALEAYRHALALDPTLKTVQADIERLQR